MTPSEMRPVGPTCPPLACTVSEEKSPWKPGSPDVSVPRLRYGVKSTRPVTRLNTTAGTAEPYQFADASMNALERAPLPKMALEELPERSLLLMLTSGLRLSVNPCTPLTQPLISLLVALSTAVAGRL